MAQMSPMWVLACKRFHWKVPIKLNKKTIWLGQFLKRSAKWDKEAKNIDKDKVCKYGVVLFRETLTSMFICQKQLLYLQAWVPNGLTWAIIWAMVENFETNCGALFRIKNKRLLAIVWNIECYHYHFHIIVGWLQPLNCVGATSFIWTTWCWTQDLLWTHGFKGCQDINLFNVFLDSFFIPNAHNMLTLMLDLVFKRLKFVMDYLAHEKAKLLATKYDRNFLLPMLVKCLIPKSSYLKYPSSTYRMTIQFTLWCSSFMQGGKKDSYS
jgi:hypothetical protein